MACCFRLVKLMTSLAVVAMLLATVSCDDDDDKEARVRSDGARRRHVEPLVYHVDEQVRVGSLVANLTAGVQSACSAGDHTRWTDCNNVPVRFTRLHQRPTGAMLFSVDETTGVLRTSAAIDREEICVRWEPVCSVLLEVAVHYAGVGAFDVAVIEVYINDINDNPPVFSATSPLRLSISETAVPGDPMATFQLPLATDADGPANSVVGYQLLPQTASSLDYFRLTLINSSLEALSEVRLSLTSPLDREVSSQHQLTLVAYDSGVPPLTSSLLIVVSVDDANDNSPVFDQREYDVTLPETAPTGTEVVVIRAVDADAEANGRVRYRFSARGRGRADLRLDERSGVVTVARPLDFGRQSEYSLGVLAEDDGVGGLASFAMLTVRVVDENNHRPVIDVDTEHTGSGSVSRVTVDVPAERGHSRKFIAHVSASDDDGGENGRITCRLDVVSVNSTDQLTEFDRLNSLFARPTSNNSTDFQSAVIRNQSSDDVAAAAFDLVELFENEYTITANVTTTLDDGWSTSDVEYHLQVTCHDHGLPTSLTSSVAVHVTIRYHDNHERSAAVEHSRPSFVFPTTGNDTVYIAAGLPVGHVVASVRATNNADNFVSYELVDGNGSAYFDVDCTSGHVTVVSALPVDNATLQLVVGVSAASQSNISMISVGELYIVIVAGARMTDVTFSVVATTIFPENNDFSHWSVWLAGRNWSTLVLIVVISCSLVLGTILFAAIFFLCRRPRDDWSILSRRRRRGSGRKVTSSYHMAVEFTATEDGLNNVAMLHDMAPSGGRAPASLLGPSSSCIGSMQALYGKPTTVDHACNINDELRFSDKAKAMSLPDILLVNPCEVSH